MSKLFIEDLDLKGKRVLVRVDFNVPLDGSGGITDDTRIRAALPTIRYVVARGGKAILMSHLGRPDGKRDPAASLSPVAVRLSELLGKPVAFAADCVGEKAATAVAGMKGGDGLTGQSPSAACRSVWQTPDAFTLTRIWPGPATKRR